MSAQPTPPRALSAQELAELSNEDKTKYIATWSSYNAYLRKDQERRSTAPQGVLRGGLANGFRGRGRGQSHYGGYQAHPYPPVASPGWRGGGRKFANISREFNTPPRPTAAISSLVPPLKETENTRL
ncbi:hypothetical protein P154DRAFT_523258 [Amniculicola lignicola CBS 123094]|uniref:Uncharacterized protein n=1 Tax=Amniculicola lignicola CBS 123094 TaxID=1392246 RepID=A0A6A5WH29_9PLEO|nr:hypothetical protein P154DRAFT_523258 [Amniculicola lignicola CBS 123094]